jgi:hypothetical protein
MNVALAGLEPGMLERSLEAVHAFEEVRSVSELTSLLRPKRD